MIKGLYAITNETLMPGEQLVEKTEAALAGGCRLIQYRNKSRDSELREREARALRALCDRHAAHLIINDDVPLARAVGADGVHLGQDDEAPRSAREILGPDAIIGATCHASLTLAEIATRARVDYLAFGRFFPSHTKPQALPATLELLQQVKQRLKLPTVAIGGIHMDNAASLVTAGADCLAVSHDIFRGRDLEQIRERAARYTALFSELQESR